MKQKKWIAFLLSFMFVVSMTACQPAENENADPSQTQETQDTAQTQEDPATREESDQQADADIAEGSTEPPKDGLVCFSNTSLSYFFFVVEQEAAKRAAEGYGYRFESASAEFESVAENNNFNNFIAMNPIAIIADPADTDGIIASLEKCAAKNIPVAVIDATVGQGGKANVTVTFDNYKAGAMAAEKIVELLTERYGEPKGRVLNAYGIQNNEAIRNRRQGFSDIMAKYPAIEYVEMPGEGNMDTTMDVALNALAKYETFDAMHAPSDSPCMGLYEALKKTENLKKVGEEGHVILVTIDGEPIAIERIKEGYYDASVNQDAVAYSEIGMEMLYTYALRGLPVPVGTKYENDKYYWKETDIVESDNGPMLLVPAYYIDKSNADDPAHWGNVAINELGLSY